MILGIDLGGTKSAALLLHEDGTVAKRVAAPTPADADAEGLFAFLMALAQEIRGTETLTGVGVSVGGATDAAKGLVFAAPNLPGWGAEGFPLAARLSEALQLPVKLENDADATARAGRSGISPWSLEMRADSAPAACVAAWKPMPVGHR